MSDEPLTNAAVERFRAGLLRLNVMAQEAYTGGGLSDDFVLDDRRSGCTWR